MTWLSYLTETFSHKSYKYKGPPREKKKEINIHIYKKRSTRNTQSPTLSLATIFYKIY